MYKIEDISYSTHEVVGTSRRSFSTRDEAALHLKAAGDLPLYNKLEGFTGNDFFYHRIVKV